MDDDFEVSFPEIAASQWFFEDPLENLRLHVMVKRVPPQVRPKELNVIRGRAARMRSLLLRHML